MENKKISSELSLCYNIYHFQPDQYLIWNRFGQRKIVQMILIFNYFFKEERVFICLNNMLN